MGTRDFRGREARRLVLGAPPTLGDVHHLSTLAVNMGGGVDVPGGGRQARAGWEAGRVSVDQSPGGVWAVLRTQGWWRGRRAGGQRKGPHRGGGAGAGPRSVGGSLWWPHANPRLSGGRRDGTVALAGNPALQSHLDACGPWSTVQTLGQPCAPARGEALPEAHHPSSDGAGGQDNAPLPEHKGPQGRLSQQLPPQGSPSPAPAQASLHSQNNIIPLPRPGPHRPLCLVSTSLGPAQVGRPGPHP